MKRAAWVAVALLAMAGGARASDPVGIYAVVDKVAFEPVDGTPMRIQVWGVFALAEPGGGDRYTPPQRGYLYYSLKPGKEDVSRKEWADLKRVAGTGNCIGFGSRYAEKGKVRVGHADPKGPDVYPTEFGLQKVGNDHPVAEQLRSLPSPVSPTEGSLVPPGPVTLEIRNLPGTDYQKAKYVFELENSAGQKETSEPIAAGDKETGWTPKMKVKPSEKCLWRVWAVTDKGKGLATITTFLAKGQR